MKDGVSVSDNEDAKADVLLVQFGVSRSVKITHVLKMDSQHTQTRQKIAELPARVLEGTCREDRCAGWCSASDIEHG